MNNSACCDSVRHRWLGRETTELDSGESLEILVSESLPSSKADWINSSRKDQSSSFVLWFSDIWGSYAQAGAEKDALRPDSILWRTTNNCNVDERHVIWSYAQRLFEKVALRPHPILWETIHDCIVYSTVIIRRDSQTLFQTLVRTVVQFYVHPSHNSMEQGVVEMRHHP
jgi:hypothetical protein